MSEKCFILVGLESSGNHMFHSLFSQLMIGGTKILGTDLAGWTDGVSKHHSDSLLEPVWQGQQSIQEITHGASFVTGRSFPCGCAWPDIRKFHSEAQASGYSPLVVVLCREPTIIEYSSMHRGMNADIGTKAKMLQEAVKGLRCRYISYESLLLFGSRYFRQWLSLEDEKMTINDAWFSFIRNENKKYIHPARGDRIENGIYIPKQVVGTGS